MIKPRIGLLPLFLMLYDESLPDLRPQLEEWMTELVSRLVQAGLDVTIAPTVRTAAEAEKGIEFFRKSGIDLLVTLHLAYSPSLESAPALVAAEWPIALFDTTQKPEFDETAALRDMTENHGIHGVQDLACMLRRLGRRYVVVAGHPDVTDVIGELADWARAAAALSALKGCKTGLVGRPFKGMGDFSIEFDRLSRRFGVEVVDVSLAEIAAAAAALAPDEMAAEEAKWRERFVMEKISRSALDPSLRACLALRKCLARAGCESFTMNFQAFTAEAGVPTVPFLEASLAMERGAGYAGEGDVLTASFVGAINRVYGATTFTEMFCADWKGGTIFMSHMGECNVALAAGRPALVEKDYRFSSVPKPVIAVFKVKSGPAVLFNVAPGPNDSIAIIAAQVEILDRGPAENFRQVPHFWIRPQDLNAAEFLKRYSEFGGTHHSGITAGGRIEDVARFAELAGIEFHRVC